MAASGKGHPDGVEITTIGFLYKGPLEKKYWSSSRGKEKYPYPIGYQATRCHGGHCYAMEVSEGPRGPLFVVTCEEGIACSGQTPSIPWENILRKRHAGVKKISMRSSATSIDGPEMFGFTNPLVQCLCRDLVVSASDFAEQSEVRKDSKRKAENADASAVERGKDWVFSESSRNSPSKGRMKKLTISTDVKDTERGAEMVDMNAKQLGKHAKRRSDMQGNGNKKLAHVPKGSEGQPLDLEGTGSKYMVIIEPELSMEAGLLFGTYESEEVIGHSTPTKRPRSIRSKVSEKNVELTKIGQTTRGASESGSENIKTVTLVSTRKKRMKGQENIVQKAVKMLHSLNSERSVATNVDVVEDSVSPGPEEQEGFTSVSAKSGERRIGSQNGITSQETPSDSAAVDEALPKNVNGKKKRLRLARPDKSLPRPLPKPENMPPVSTAKPKEMPSLPLSMPKETPTPPLAKREIIPPLVLVNPEKMSLSPGGEKYGISVDLTQSEYVLSIDLMCPSVDIRSSEPKSGGAHLHSALKNTVSSAQQDGVCLVPEACNQAVNKDGSFPGKSSRDKGVVDAKRKENSPDGVLTVDMYLHNDVSVSPAVQKSLPLCEEEFNESTGNMTSDDGQPSEARALEGGDIIQGRHDSSGIGSFVVHQDTARVELPTTLVPPERMENGVLKSDGAFFIDQKTIVEVKRVSVLHKRDTDGDDSQSMQVEILMPSIVENKESGICFNPSMPSRNKVRTVSSASTAPHTEVTIGINNAPLTFSGNDQCDTHMRPITPGIGDNALDESLGPTVSVGPKDEGIEKLHVDRTENYGSQLKDSLSLSKGPLDGSEGHCRTTLKDTGLPSLVPGTNFHLRNQDERIEVEEIIREVPAWPSNYAVISTHEGVELIPEAEYPCNSVSANEIRKQLSVPIVQALGAEEIVALDSSMTVTSEKSSATIIEAALPSMHAKSPPVVAVMYKTDQSILATGDNVYKKCSVAEVPNLPAVLPSVAPVVCEVDQGLKVTAENVSKKNNVVDVPSLPVVLPSAVEVASEMAPGAKVVGEANLDNPAVPEVPSLPVVISKVDPSTKDFREFVVGKASTADVPLVSRMLHSGNPVVKVIPESFPEETCVGDGPSLTDGCGVQIRTEYIPETTFLSEYRPLPAILVKENEFDSAISFGKIMENGVVTILSPSYKMDLLTDTLPDDLDVMATRENVHEETHEEGCPPLPFVSMKENEFDTAGIFGKITERSVVAASSPSHPMDLLADTLPDLVPNNASQLCETGDGETLNNSMEAGVAISDCPSFPSLVSHLNTEANTGAEAKQIVENQDHSHREEGLQYCINEFGKNISGANLSWPLLIQKHATAENTVREAKHIFEEGENHLAEKFQCSLFPEQPLKAGRISCTGEGLISNNKSRHPEEHLKVLLSEHQIGIDESTAVGLGYADIMKAGLDNLKAFENGFNLEEKGTTNDAAVTNSEEETRDVGTSSHLPSHIQPTLLSKEHTRNDESKTMSDELTKSMLTLLLPPAFLLKKGVRCEKQCSSDKCNDVELEEQNSPIKGKTAVEVFSHDQNVLGIVEEPSLVPLKTLQVQEQGRAYGFVGSGCHRMNEMLDYEGLPSTVKQLNDSKKMESALCIDHSLPVLAMVLNVRGDEVRLCVVCGLAESDERTFFVYQVLQRGEDDVKPLLLCTVSSSCEKTVYRTLNVQIPMEESAVQFSPDGQHLLLLDCFTLPQSFYTTIENDRGHGVNIVSFEKEVFRVTQRLQSDGLMQCLIVPGPQLMIAAGHNGCINCWEMDSGWNTCMDRFSLPRALCDGAPFKSITRLAVRPGSPHMVLGCDYGGSFALWDTRNRTLVLSCHLPNHNVLNASWLDITTISLEHAEVFGKKSQCEVPPQKLAMTDSLSDSLQCLLTMVSCRGGSTLNNKGRAMKCYEEKDVQEKDMEWSCKAVILKSGSIHCVPGLPDRVSAVTSLGRYGVMGTTGGLVQIWEVASGQKICELNELEGSSIVTLATNPSSAVLATANAKGQVILYFEKDNLQCLLGDDA